MCEGLVIAAWNVRTARRWKHALRADGFGDAMTFRDITIEVSRFLGLISGAIVGFIYLLDATSSTFLEHVVAYLVVYLGYTLIFNANVMFFGNRWMRKEVAHSKGIDVGKR
jgi:hypothetical protein